MYDPTATCAQSWFIAMMLTFGTVAGIALVMWCNRAAKRDFIREIKSRSSRDPKVEKWIKWQEEILGEVVDIPQVSRVDILETPFGNPKYWNQEWETRIRIIQQREVEERETRERGIRETEIRERGIRERETR